MTTQGNVNIALSGKQYTKRATPLYLWGEKHGKNLEQYTYKANLSDFSWEGISLHNESIEITSMLQNPWYTRYTTRLSHCFLVLSRLKTLFSMQCLFYLSVICMNVNQWYIRNYHKVTDTKCLVKKPEIPNRTYLAGTNLPIFRPNELCAG